jgi:hypothetical protein
MAAASTFDLSRFSRVNDRLQQMRRSLFMAAGLAIASFLIGGAIVTLIYGPAMGGSSSALLQAGGFLIGAWAGFSLFLFTYRQLGVPPSAFEIRSDGIILSTSSGRHWFVAWRQENQRLSIQVRIADTKLPPEAHYRLVVWPKARGLRRFAIPYSQVIPYTYLPEEAAEQILDTAAAHAIPISVERNADLRENRKPVTVYRINVSSDTPVQVPYRRGEGLRSAGG